SEVLPDGSVATALTVCSPSGRAWPSGTVTSQAPVTGSAVVVSSTSPMVTTTSLPGSAVPVTVGVSSAVTSPSAGVRMTGGSTSVSTVKTTGDDAGLVLPAPSTWV